MRLILLLFRVPCLPACANIHMYAVDVGHESSVGSRHSSVCLHPKITKQKAKRNSVKRNRNIESAFT